MNAKSYVALLLLTLTTSFHLYGETHLKKEYRIAYINSYHPGHDWADRTYNSFTHGLSHTHWSIYPFYMDTKRNPTISQLKQTIKDAKAFIKSIQPHLIIAAEDNASKLIIQPYYLNKDIPVIFAGVNVDATQYDYPGKNVTGLIEMDRVVNLIKVIRHYFKKNDVGMIFSNTTTSTKKFHHFNGLGINDFEAIQVSSGTDWREAIARFNSEKDFILLDTISGIKNLTHKTAKEIIIHEVDKPVLTISSTSQALAHIGYINVPEEHGNWAAQAALKILGGKSPLQIPIETSRFYKMFINQPLIDEMQINIPDSLYKLKHETFY